LCEACPLQMVLPNTVEVEERGDMHTLALAEQLRAAAESISEAPSRAGRIAPSLLRLSDLVQVRAPLEDLGAPGARVYEAAPTLLAPRRPLPARLRVRPWFVGIDSGSRGVETPLAGIAIAAVSVSLSAPLELFDWPPIHPGLEPPRWGPPFVRILPNWEGWDPPLPPGAASVNPAGERYGPEYSMAQALDEARVSLENWALSVLPEAVEGGPGGLVVLVDGPLYLVPGALANSGAPRVYREAWERLLGERVEAVRRLEALGVPVIGVVKRVSRSRILSRAQGLGDLVESCVGPGDHGDEMVVYRAYASCARRIPGRIYRTPIVRVDPPGIGAPKLVEYLAIPPGRWQSGPEGVRITRLEYTERGLALLREELGLEPYQLYSLSSIASGSLLPLVLLASDRRSRTIARALARFLRRELARRGVPLSYETVVEEMVEGGAH